MFRLFRLNLNNIGNKPGFETYDVYVYIDGDDERTDGDNFMYEISGTTGQYTGKRYMNDWKGSTFNGEFREVTETNQPVRNADGTLRTNLLGTGATPNLNMVGNFVVFRGATGANFNIAIKNFLTASQQPLNMPSIAGIQVVGTGRLKVDASRASMLSKATDVVAQGGDYDKDVVLGDNGSANFTIDVPYGIEDKLSFANAQNKAFTVASDPSSTIANATASSQSDFIVTGRNQDLVLGGNGSDAIDSGVGADVVFGDNGRAEMNDYNPIGVRLPLTLKILDDTQTNDNDAYIGRANSDSNQFQSKLGSNFDQVKGVSLVASTQGGNDVVDGGQDNDLIFGQEGDDILIDNEGKDDVVVGNAGNNFVTAARTGLYTDVTQYLGDLTSVLATLDQNDRNVVSAFGSNDFGTMQTLTLGDIIKGKGSAAAGSTGTGTGTGTSTGTGTGTGTSTGTGTTTTTVRSINISNSVEQTVTIAADETVEIISTTWPVGNQWYTPNVGLVVSSANGATPGLAFSWDESGIMKTSTQAANYYYVVDVPDSPNTVGKYVIRVKGLAAGSFKVKLA